MSDLLKELEDAQVVYSKDDQAASTLFRDAANEIRRLRDGQSDLPTRLRFPFTIVFGGRAYMDAEHVKPTMLEAADEIERLRAQVEGQS